MSPSSNPSGRRWREWLAGACVVTLMGGAVVLHQHQSDRELLSIPTAERRALYDRTLATLSTACEHPPGPAVSDYCQAQAELIERLPECDAACHRLVRHLSSRFSR